MGVSFLESLLWCSSDFYVGFLMISLGKYPFQKHYVTIIIM